MTSTVTIDDTGISVLSYSELLQNLQDAFHGIYGADAILDADTPDGQWLAIEAAAQNDLAQTLVAGFLSFSPDYAQGVQLSSLVKINGLRRQSATKSACVVTLSGVAGTEVLNGKVQSSVDGTLWDLPASVVIGIGGTQSATATCENSGATTAAPSTLTIIATPTRGWQSVTNSGSASPGAPVESDAQLRQRQAGSVSLPAQAIIESISAGVSAVTGVVRSYVYENDTAVTDGNGIPAHSIAAVVNVGTASALSVATAIARRKPPGVQTAGSTPVSVTDSRGQVSTINFYPLTDVPLTLQITVTPLAGFVSSTKALIAAAVAKFINGLAIGEDSYLNRLYKPANLSGPAAMAATGLTQPQLDVLAETYNVASILQKRGAGSLAAVDLTIAFNEAATCLSSAVNVLP